MTTSLDFTVHHGTREHYRAAHAASYDVVRGAQHMVELGGQLTTLVQIAATKRIGDDNALLLAEALQQFDEIARELRALAPRIARALAA